DAVREVLRDMLIQLGHRAVACASGDEALRQHSRGRFQLMLTDLGMPGMTGWKLAEVIRQRDPEVVIAFVTGWGQEVETEAARQAGADRVMTKPFSFEDVIEATRLAMGRLERAA